MEVLTIPLVYCICMLLSGEPTYIRRTRRTGGVEEEEKEAKEGEEEEEEEGRKR